MTLLLTAAAVFLAVVHGGAPAAPASDDKLNIFVSIPPQAYFVKKIGGQHAEISVMVEPRQSPASYEPSPRQMVKLARADLYFAIGVPFEAAWLSRFRSANPDMKIIHTEAGVEKKPIDRHGKGQGAHGSHEAGIQDPHIWLSPPLVMIQARHILDGLISADPDHRADYESGYLRFIRSLAELDLRLMKQLAGIENQRFMVFHPSWGYFADAYGLRQIPIEIEGKEPKAKEVQELIEAARANGIDAIFVQPQFSTRQAGIIADEIGGRLVVADPLAEEWAENLESIAAAIKSQAG
jgi:zinc transport system substrate-binding protein